MKKYLLSLLLISSTYFLNAQIFNTDTLIKLKKQGLLTGQEQFYNPTGGTTNFYVTKKPAHTNKHTNKTAGTTSTCNCWITRDSSFHAVPLDGSGSSTGPGIPPNYANDDWSTNPIILPFNFCLYGNAAGNAANPLFINNNGNISFGSAYSTFSAVAFPSNQYSMVAPFWSDVDTDGPNSRFVWYKMTPTALIIQWDSVGYYYAHDDKLNTYQLILTDGTDPILPAGNNVSFCYGDMQWTTGDASQGVNGFGGTPATVGINKGDGTNYIQISLFDHAGTNYTNPAGVPASGVDWLDYKSFNFNCCGSGANLPPIAAGASVCGDTLTICGIGDTLIYSTTFQAPELNQLVTCTGNGGSLPAGHFSVLSTTTGVNGSITFMVTTNGLAAGYYNVSTTGTDNGTPPLSTTVNYVIHVINNPIPTPNITLVPNPACLSQNPIVTLTNCSQFSTHIWSNGDTACSFPVTTTDTLYLTVTKTGCYKSVITYIKVSPNPVITTGGVLTYCPPSNGTTVFVNLPLTQGLPPYTFSWDGGTPSANDTLHNATNGTHSVLVTDANGCTGTASLTVTSNAPTLTITSTGNLCTGAVTLSSSIPNGTSYLWSPGGQTTHTISVTSGGVYSLTVAVNNCNVPATFTVSPPVLPIITITGDTVLCPGQSTTLTASAAPSGTYTYVWYNNATNIGTTSSQTINAPGNHYSIVAVNSSTQCKDSLPFFVNVYTNPSVSITGLPTVCQGHNDLLTANATGGHPGYSYAWHPVTATTQTVNVTSANTYYVIVTDSKQCKDSASIIIKLGNPHLLVPSVHICPGSTAILHANGTGQVPLSYLWYPSLITGNTFTTTTAGNYEVVMTDTYGCKDSVTVSVLLNPVPNANITYFPASPVDAGTTVVFTDASTVTTGSVVTDSWTFGDTAMVVHNNFNPSHVYANGGHYPVTLIVKSDKGCIDTIVTFIDVQYPIVAPNIITPNGDGLNEYLEFKNLLYFKNNKLWIYNRWGTQLYQSDDYKNNWTGAPYSDGTYYYVLEIPDKKQTIKGFFTSVR